MTLTKANIVEAVAEQIGYTKNQSVNTIRWHPLRLSAGHEDLAQSLRWYLDNPSCIVLMAEKSIHPSV